MEENYLILVESLGRIKTKKIKRSTHRIFDESKDLISDNFDENKKVINEKYGIESKKLRNTIAGYCTRLKKSEQQ